MQSNILDRIRKLLALASNNPNEHEAATAAAQAAKLMLEHKIEQLQLDEAINVNRPVQTTEEEIDSAGKQVAWRNTLAAAVAKANGCHVLLVGGGKSPISTRVFGTANDVATTRYLYTYLANVVDRLAKAHGGGRSAGYAFRLGAVMAVRERLRAARDEHETNIKQSASGSNAIALVNREALAVKTAFEARTRGYSAGKPRKVRPEASAFNAGKAAGQSINLASGRGALGKPATQMRG